MIIPNVRFVSNQINVVCVSYRGSTAANNSPMKARGPSWQQWPFTLYFIRACHHEDACDAKGNSPIERLDLKERTGRRIINMGKWMKPSQSRDSLHRIVFKSLLGVVVWKMRKNEYSWSSDNLSTSDFGIHT
uniref:Uncharacterized protein n=1 Tax=Panagrellus redivivus TaxID=6233 RepID=A0A7E4VQN1_PANRE